MTKQTQLTTLDTAQYILDQLDKDAKIEVAKVYALIYLAEVYSRQQYNKTLHADTFMNTANYLPIPVKLEKIVSQYLNNDDKIFFHAGQNVGGVLTKMSEEDCYILDTVISEYEGISSQKILPHIHRDAYFVSTGVGEEITFEL